MGIEIRPAQKRDAALIADMSRQAFYDSFADSNTQEDMQKFMNEQFTRDDLIEEVQTDNGIFFLAYNENEPSGYVRMHDGEYYDAFGKRSSIEIVRIYAVKSSIGKGVGSALMKSCIETASQLNRQIIWLGVWENNTRAIDFYIKWGFIKFGQHNFTLGNDVQTDWLMMKEIG